MGSNRSNDVLEWTISEVRQGLVQKEISPVEITKATIEHIQEADQEINSFITVMEEEALKQAEIAEKEILSGNSKGELHGVPIGLKDLIYTKGTRTTMGSGVYEDFIPEYDAEVVTRLKQAGAILIGKLNMHEFAYGTTGDRSYFGPVKNPRNTSKVTGGSSSGSGAAVASHFCYGAIGSDTGGSIRIPASCCGIVGMKPTFGLVSKHGAKTLCWTLDHLGPMTRTVKDNAILLNCLAGYDAKDPYSVKSEPEDYSQEIELGIKGKAIGIPTSFYFDIMEPEVKKVFDQRVTDMEKQGAQLIPVDLPYMNELLLAQQVILAAEAYSALEKEIREAPEKIDSEVRDRIVSGMLIQANEYIRMLQIKHMAIQMFHEALAKVDVIITPTLCALPTDIEQREIDFNGLKEHPRIFARLTGPCDTLGFPAISIPGGVSKDGLPVGIQLIGRPFDEKKLYRFASAIERENG